MKSRNQLKGKKEASYGFAWDMAGERNEGVSEFCLGSSESTSELVRVFQYNRQNQDKLDGNMTANELKKESSVWDGGMCRRLYERQTEDEASVFAGLVDQDDDDDDDDDNSCGKKITFNKTSADGADDRNLAQLIAKFDHSIEALWNPDDAPSTSPDNISSDDPADCDQDLPMDFKQLLSSPSEQYVTVELYNLNNKRNPCIFSSSNSFIQCGTNITSSIWSDQPSQENSIDQDDYGGMDYMQSEQHSFKDSFEDAKDNDYDEANERKLTVLLVGEEKVVGSKLNVDEQHVKGDRYQEKDYSNSLFGNSGTYEIGKCSEEKGKFTWNKYESFPSLFANMPWSLNYSLGEMAQNAGSKAWCEMEKVGSGNYSLGNLCSGGNGFSNTNNSTGHSSNSDLKDSLNTLNHNKEDSCFTEVIPKHNSLGKIQPGKFDFGVLQANKDSEHDCHMECKEDGDMKPGLSESEKEEEDLLTSARTHFRPIRMEGIDLHRNINASNNNSNNNNNVGSYADGTTFVIPTSLEEVAFRRSESGALYLETEAETGMNSPNKYMEYKEKEAYGLRHHCEKQVKSSLETGCEFIPKFKVRQNEKCCQTEELDEIMQSDDEVDTKRSRQDVKVSDDFYFPDDDQFAEKIINCLEDNCGTELSTCPLQKEKYVSDGSSLLYYNSQKERSEYLNQTAAKQPDVPICKCGNEFKHVQKWPITTQVPPQPGVWASAENKTQPWCSIWKSIPSSESRCHCGMSPLNPAESQTLPKEEPKTNESLQYSRLREELTMEGEQLMSDLSYMQHLYQGSDWQEDTVIKDMSEPTWNSSQQENENENDRKLHCLSPAEDSAQEMLLYAEDAGSIQSLPVPHSDHQGLMKERKSKDDFDVSCHSNTSPKELEAEWNLNERPFSTKAAQKDRKRRHSASQRTCSQYLEGSCRRPHCRFSHDLATVPCRYWADKSCSKGNACPFLHGSAQALRPVTL
ncbi:hypothetical protein C0J52_02345 [Blattella germanica]|nr:hypothetical protein C0J52_02345 [Blattella germanica]